VAVAGLKLLVTGFGPFPGAPRNPTEALVAALAGEPAEAFGVGALKAIVLPTDYHRSWRMLRRLYAGYAPDVVVHFGLSLRAEAIHVERVARNTASPAKRDAAGYAPPSRRARRSGPDVLQSTLPVTAIVEALTEAGFPAVSSDDAGAYVCNATLYRSLLAMAAQPGRLVGFIHVPPTGKGDLTAERLREAALVVLRNAMPNGGIAARTA
jgi:pyroglutamyl-peptidase